MNSTHSATEMPYVLRQQTNSVVTLTLNRASKFNPLSEEMMTALQTRRGYHSNQPQYFEKRHGRFGVQNGP